MLFIGIMFGFLVPFPGLVLDKSVVPFGTIAVGCIFLLSGLKLNTDEICQAIKEWKGIIYGSFPNPSPVLLIRCYFWPNNSFALQEYLASWCLPPRSHLFWF